MGITFLRRLPRLALLCVGALGLTACGGSSSETPWPVEPDNVDLGPVGESRAEEAGTANPNGGSPKDKAEPSMEDQTVAPRVPKSEPLAP